MWNFLWTLGYRYLPAFLARPLLAYVSRHDERVSDKWLRDNTYSREGY